MHTRRIYEKLPPIDRTTDVQIQTLPASDLFFNRAENYNGRRPDHNPEVTDLKAFKYMRKLFAYALLGCKLAYNNSGKYLTPLSAIHYFL